MSVAVDKDHVNVTKRHSVAFALVSRDLKVTTWFAVSLCIQVSLLVKLYSSSKYLCFQKVINAKQTPQSKK